MIVHRIAIKVFVTTVINQVRLNSILFYFITDQFSSGHISRDCTEQRSNNYGGGGGGGGGYRSGRGKLLLCTKNDLYS